MNVVVIATYKAPTSKESAERIFEVLKNSLKGLVGIKFVHGPMCFNWCLCFEGEVPERAVDRLTLALMPARWSLSSSAGWKGVVYELSGSC